MSGSYFVAVLLLYLLASTALGLALAPALWAFDHLASWGTGLPGALPYLALGTSAALCFVLAGLTTLPVWKIMIVAVLVRAPALTVSAAVGSGQLDWRSPWVIGGFIVLMSIGALGVRYQDRIEQWIARYAAARPASGRRQADLDL